MQSDNFDTVDRQLTNILKYPIIQAIYEFIAESYNKAKEKTSKNNSALVQCFRDSVRLAPSLPKSFFITETEKIRNISSSNKSDLDTLIDAVIKTKICILSKFNTNKYELFNHKIEIDVFIQKCYIESCKYAYNEFHLICQDNNPTDTSKNISHFKSLIGKSIEHSLDYMIPLNLILPNYINSLKNMNSRNITFVDNNSPVQNNTIDVGNEIANNFLLQDTKLLNSVVHKENENLNIIKQTLKKPSISPKLKTEKKSPPLKLKTEKKLSISAKQIGGVDNQKEYLSVGIKPKKDKTTLPPITSQKSLSERDEESEDIDEEVSEAYNSTERSEMDVITKRRTSSRVKNDIKSQKHHIEQFG